MIEGQELAPALHRRNSVKKLAKNKKKAAKAIDKYYKIVYNIRVISPR
jgi:hypothetical protein